MNYSIVLPRPFFVLAPMDDVTDTVFRQVITTCAAPDLAFTEFVNVDGLQSAGRPNLLKKLRFTDREAPLVAQIWGKEPANFYQTAQQLADGTFAREMGLAPGVNFVGVDLNMGCPQKNEVKHGTCCALINDRPLAAEIIKATKDGLANRLPLSVKTRMGYGSVDMTWIEFLLKQNLRMLTVHGRTKAQMSKEPANWELIGQARELRDQLAPETLLVGNGDVQNRQHGLKLIQKYQLDGVMIARGIFHDPFAFVVNSPWPNFSRLERLKLYQKHVNSFVDTWQHRERPVHTLNKFCKIYINGFDGAKELRDQLMHARTTEELDKLLAIALKDVVAESQPA